MKRPLTLDERIDRCSDWYAWDDRGEYLGEVNYIDKGFLSGEEDIYDDPDAYTLSIVTQGTYYKDTYTNTYRRYLHYHDYRVPAEHIQHIDDADGVYADKGIVKENKDEEAFPLEPTTIVLKPYGEDHFDKFGFPYDEDGDIITRLTKEQQAILKEYNEEFHPDR